MATLSVDGPMPPLVIRNKRGRKVDETLPKSHQREVQRQFRARRAGHLIDLERRVSLLERENVILRQWAGVQPSTRVLLGRGPTGCDTTKPLIADESDEEIQLFLEEHSPHDRNWPETPTGRNSFPADHAHPQAHQQYADAGHSGPSPISSQMQSSLHPRSSLADGQLASVPMQNIYEKPPANYDNQPYPETHKYKPHPLYSHQPLEAHLPPLPPPHFDQNSSALATDRVLIKRESTYATPTASLLTHAPLPPQPPSVQQQQQTTATHSGLSHGAGYYIPHRPSYALPSDQYTSLTIHDQQITPTHTGNGVGHGASYASQSTSQWPDPYMQHNSTPTSSTGQMINRRPQPTLMTPVTPVMPNGGPASGSISGSSSSPTSQPNSGVDMHPNMNGNSGNTNMNGGMGGNVSNTGESAYMSQHRRSLSYSTMNGSSLNLSGGATVTSSGYMPPPSSAQFGSYVQAHQEGPQEGDNFR